MLDTKLKKIRNSKVLIIALVILLPAVILTSLYPRMEKVYRSQTNKITGNSVAAEEQEKGISSYSLDPSFVNYAMEASYYLYGQMLQERTKKEVDFTVLDKYGWIDDYYSVIESCAYYAITENGSRGEGTSGYDLSYLLLDDGDVRKSSLIRKLDEEEGYLGYLVLEFDGFGNISNVHINNFGELEIEDGLYSKAQASIRQYENNVYYYNASCDAGAEVIENELRPKEFRAVFLVDEECEWIYSGSVTFEGTGYYNAHDIFIDMGVLWLIVGAGIWIILAAMILPFFKKLNTGWEKLFCIPAEIVFCIALCAIDGFVLMYEAMVGTCYPILMENLSFYGELNFLGYEISPDMVYYIMLVLNVLGWAAVFFMEYITVASFRQFLCGPLRYLKEKFLCVRFCRFIGKQCGRFYDYLTDIHIGAGLHRSILRVVLVNAAVVTACCCFWFVGWIGVIIYSVLLYLALRKYGEVLQKQYGALVDAASQMAEGNLKSELPEELGVFTELGTELEKVQDGFAKAVAEEAKSQNMKTELITNVSHDLKTPLTAIITYVDLLKKENITEEERDEYISTLDRKSQRLKTLIEDLFEVSKATTNNIVMDYSEVDLVNLLKQVHLENEDRIKDSTLDVRLILPEKKCVSHLDPNRTYRIMDNLLQNALKYSMPHSRVYVELEERETEYRISFKNISAVEMNFDAGEITERFVRGDLSRNTEGSGLGLAIAQSFTQLQNGKFEIGIDGDLFKVVLRFERSENLEYDPLLV